MSSIQSSVSISYTPALVSHNNKKCFKKRNQDLKALLFIPQKCFTKRESVIAKYQNISQVYSHPSQTSKIKLFTKIVNGFQSFNIFTNNSILDVWLGSECNCAFIEDQYQGSNKICAKHVWWSRPVQSMYGVHLFTLIYYCDSPWKNNNEITLNHSSYLWKSWQILKHLDTQSSRRALG